MALTEGHGRSFWLLCAYHYYSFPLPNKKMLLTYLLLKKLKLNIINYYCTFITTILKLLIMSNVDREGVAVLCSAIWYQCYLYTIYIIKVSAIWYQCYLYFNLYTVYCIYIIKVEFSVLCSAIYILFILLSLLSAM